MTGFLPCSELKTLPGVLPGMSRDQGGAGVTAVHPDRASCPGQYERRPDRRGCRLAAADPPAYPAYLGLANAAAGNVCPIPPRPIRSAAENCQEDHRGRAQVRYETPFGDVGNLTTKLDIGPAPWLLPEERGWMRLPVHAAYDLPPAIPAMSLAEHGREDRPADPAHAGQGRLRP